MSLVAPGINPSDPREIPSPPQAERGEPTRVLFLNTRDQCGADVAVHLSLIQSFDPQRTRPYLLSNSQATDADNLRAFCQRMPHLTSQFLPLGVPASQLAGQTKVGKVKALAPVLGSVLRAARWIRRWRIDLIHSTDRPRDAVLSTLLAKLTGTPNVIHMHSNAGPHLERTTVWGFQKATALFGVSEYTRQTLIQMGLPPEKIAVVHNATDPDHFDPSQIGTDTRMNIRQRLGIPVDAPVAGIVARVNPWKGQRELIEAVAALSRHYPDLYLLIIGSGEEEAPLRELVAERGLSERVLFVGQQADVRPYLSALDLFSLPSYEEPFGLAITEAMAMALPVIACHSGGVPEIITHGQDGWLVAPRSVGALRDAIHHLIADPERRQMIGLAARRRVQDSFLPSRQADRVSAIYASLTTPPRKRLPSQHEETQS